MQAQGDDRNPAMQVSASTGQTRKSVQVQEKPHYTSKSKCKYRTNPKISASTGETPLYKQKPVQLQDTESYKQIATLIGRGTQGNKIGACMPCFLYFGNLL